MSKPQFLEPKDFKTKYLDYNQKNINLVGNGSYGSVFIGSNFIVKTQTNFTTFIRELNICCSYMCPYVIYILNWTYEKLDTGKYIYVFAQPKGIPVEEALDKKLITINKVAEYVYEGMKFLHDQDLIHLDIKPQNIVCLPKLSGQGYRAVIIDFGLSMYGYKYTDGLFSYQNLGYTVNYRDPEYNIDNFNSADSDYYAYAITIARLYYRVNFQQEAPFFFFNVDFIQEDGLRNVCEVCIKPKAERPKNIWQAVESIKYFPLNFESVGSVTASRSLEASLNCNAVYQSLVTNLNFLLVKPEFKTKARTGFLAHHLIQEVLSIYSKYPINDVNSSLRINKYMICCFFLAQVIYSETDINIESIVKVSNYTVTEEEVISITNDILTELNGKVREYTQWDYAPCGSQLGYNLFLTMSCNYYDLFNNRKTVILPTDKYDDKNIDFETVVNYLNKDIFHNDVEDNQITLKTNYDDFVVPVVEAKKLPSPVPCPVIRFDLTFGAQRIIYTVDSFRSKFNGVIGKNSFFGLEVIYIVICYSESWYLLPLKYKDYILQMLNYWDELKQKYFSFLFKIPETSYTDE